MNNASGVTLWDAFIPSLIMGLCLVAILPFLDREEKYARACTVFFMTALMVRYAVWRLVDTLPPVGLTAEFVVGVCFTSVEVLMLFGSLPTMIFIARIKKRGPQVERNIPWLLAQETPPLVDVFICTYNENENILSQTIIGAQAMTYPNYRVWICDDARRDWLRDLCGRLNCGYLRRADNTHAKAGNINAAIAHVMSLPDKPEFISILDADFVPFPQFLTRTVSLMRDPTVGVVQTPQHFRNPDPIQTNLSLERVWPDEQRFFFDILQAGMDAWNVPFCCGTSSVIRLEPLRRMGGFPTDSVTEDLLVTVRLAELGYSTAYLNEPLSLGLAPEGMLEYVVQRSRWCLGFMQVFRGKSAPYKLGNGLPPRYRFMMFGLFMFWVTSYAFRLMGLVVPSLYFIFDIEAVHCTSLDAVIYFVPCVISQMIICTWLTRGCVLPLLSDVGQVLNAKEIVRSCWAGLLQPNGHKFQVTAKGGDRTKTFVQWPMLRFFLSLIVLNMVAILWRFNGDYQLPFDNAAAISLFWCWYNVVVLALACCVVIELPRMRDERYAISERVEVTLSGGSRHVFHGVDIAIGGVKLVGVPPVDLGGSVSVRMTDLTIDGLVQRIEPDAFIIGFLEPGCAREIMTRHIYSGRYHMRVGEVYPKRVLGALIARAFAAG